MPKPPFANGIAMSSDAPPDSAEFCSSCESLRQRLTQLEQENAELRSRAGLLDRFRGEFSGWRTIGLSLVAILVLSFGPAHWLGSSRSDVLDSILYGPSFASSWAHWTILYSVVALMGGGQLRRFLVLVFGAIGLSLIWYAQAWVLDDSEFGDLTLVAAFPAALIVSPVLFTSMGLGWRVMHRQNPSPAEQTSIASYLLLTAIVAALIAALSTVPLSTRAFWMDGQGRVVLIFLTPVLTAMAINVILLHGLLGPHRLRERGSIVPMLGMLALAILISPISPCWVSISQAGFIGFMPMAVFAISWTLTFTVIGAAFALTLRRLGYRLRRGSRSIAETSTLR